MKNITIPVISVFAGYDSQFLALRRFKKQFNKVHKGKFHLEFDLVCWCEIDKDAIASHNALFPEYQDRHYNDIKTVPWHRFAHLKNLILIYSSCCQDITRNGNQKGFTEDSGTRSSLIWYVLKGIRTCKPACCILENVPAILEKKFSNEFRKWQEAVDNENQLMCKDGPEYISNWTTLSAVDFGVPQNRNRCFMVSFRKDINKRCEFPIPFGLKKGAESLLEESVDENNYLSNEDTVKFITDLNQKNDVNVINVMNKDSNVITAMNKVEDTCVKRIVTPSRMDLPCCVSPTLVADANYAKTPYSRFLTTANFPRPAVLEVWQGSETKQVKLTRSKYSKRISNGSLKDILNVAKTLESNEYLRLRRLTSYECFRLMGIDDDNINKLVTSGVDTGQCFKQAGNAIVVDVLFNLYMSLFSDIHKWCLMPSVR